MRFEVRRRASVATVAVRGSWRPEDGAALCGLLSGAAAGSKVRIDLSDVEGLDAAGRAMLEGLRAVLTARGAAMAVSGDAARCAAAMRGPAEVIDLRAARAKRSPQD